MQRIVRTTEDAPILVTNSVILRRAYRCIALMTVALVPLGASGCAGSDPAPPPTGIIVVPGPVAPTPTPTPTPPTAPPTPQAFSCTVTDSVKRAEQLVIRPVGGNAAIVTIGSSSTFGAFASSPSATYPAVLQASLDQRRDLATYVVYNKGINGDTLVGTEARIERDALNFKPQLIILQIGTNDAVQQPTDAGRIALTNRLNSLVARLKPITSVVLMNGQYYPTQPAIYESYQAAIDEVSITQNVALINRYDLMKNWVRSGKLTFKDILAGDQFHPNDFTYRCMGQIAAELVTKTTVK